MFESTCIGSLRRNAACGVLAVFSAALSTATWAQQASPSTTAGGSAAPDGNTVLAD